MMRGAADMRSWPVPDRVLLVTVGVLLGVGLVMMTSASITLAERHFGNPLHYFRQQLLAVVAGLLVAGAVLALPTHRWLRAGPWLAGLAILLLVLVLVPGLGQTVNGSTRWLKIAGINVMQVSEPARLLLLIYVASYVARHGRELRSGLLGFCKPMLVIGAACVLLLLQPDFGAAVLLVCIALAVLFTGGARLREIFLVGAGGALALATLAVTSPYRLARLTGFMDPWSDPFNTGFQLIQSLIAIGSGEWFGLGLGASVQKMFYLPEAHTDFVFAVIAEEFGLLGSLMIIALYVLIVWRALVIARSAVERERVFQANIAFGIAVWLAVQVFINIGVNMGMLPTKGLTLPLLSYGRSSVLITLAALAFLLRIDLENRGLVRDEARRRSRGARR